MSKWLALAESVEGISNSFPDNRLKPVETPYSRFLPPVGGEEKESVPPNNPAGRGADGPTKPSTQHPKTNPKEVSDPKKTLRSEGYVSPHGTSTGGRPLTFTGKVVSLDAWRDLSEWERHGPSGNLWYGQTQNWERVE